MICLGARNGEILGLQFKDIDLETGKVEINKALLYNKEQGLFLSSTKDDEVRINTLPDYIIQLISKYKEQYTEYKEQYVDWQGEKNIDDCFLFVQKNGTHMHTSTPRDIMGRFAKENNLGKLNPHAFRHTYASYLLEKGVDINTVSTLLGHASVQTTYKFYSHLMGDSGQKSKQFMTELLNNKK